MLLLPRRAACPVMNRRNVDNPRRYVPLGFEANSGTGKNAKRSQPQPAAATHLETHTQTAAPAAGEMDADDYGLTFYTLGVGRRGLT